MHVPTIAVIFIGMPAPIGKSMLGAGGDPVPYQRGPPQAYLDALASKRQVEEVCMISVSVSIDGIYL